MKPGCDAGGGVVVTSDHAGSDLRANLMAYLRELGVASEDWGPGAGASADYPDAAAQAAHAVAQGQFRFGLLICGSGIGMSIAANKVAGIRAALCTSEYEGRMARAHNDANVLCLGQRVVGPGLARAILEAFLTQPFDAGRHVARVQKITALESTNLARG